MELVLTIIAVIGILLFVFSYLAYVITGFKHHFVTGFISALPVLNIVTLPALWYKARKKFLVGLLGLILFFSSWFFGADKGIKSLIKKENSSETKTSLPRSVPSNTIPLLLPTQKQQTQSKNTLEKATKSISTKTIKRPFINDTKLVALPSKALYKLAFEIVPVKEISTLSNRIVRIKIEAGTVHEGRIVNVNANTVLLKSGSMEQEFPIANIVELQLMVKK